MNEELRIRRDVTKILDVAQATNAELQKDKAIPSEFSTADRAEKTLASMSERVETTKNQGENILSRLRAGVINQDVAKKQMKDLLTNECGELLGIVMRYKGIAPDLKINEDQIREAMSKVSQKLS